MFSAPQISFHSGANGFDIAREGQMAASLLQDLIHVAWKILARANLASDRPDLNRAGWPCPGQHFHLPARPLLQLSAQMSCPEDLP